MSLLSRPLSVSSLLATALLAVAPMASAATPGLVQGANGWYEDIRFFTPDTAEVPTRVGVDTGAAWGEMAFTSVTAGTVRAWSSVFEAPGSIVEIEQLIPVQSLSASWQGLGVASNGLIDPNEGLSLMFDRQVDLIGLTLFVRGNVMPDVEFIDDGASMFLTLGAQPSYPGLQVIQSSPVGGVTQLQLWFAQPYQTEFFTLSGRNAAYHLGAVQIAAVPEPGTVAMAVTGLMVVGWAAARRRKQQA
jgi:hypothetical protein